MKQVAGLIFHAPLGTSGGEELVERSRWAVTVELVRRLHAAGLADIFVVTPDPARYPSPHGPITYLDSGEPESFHFGRAFQRLIRRLDLDGVVYFGSGSGALLSEDDLARLIEFARGEAPRALFNNFYSCDFCAISGARGLLPLSLPDIDNPLGFTLADSGFPCFALPRSAATQFDIDTPIDVLLLQRSNATAGDVRSFLVSVNERHPSLDRALATLADRSALTCVIGRMSPVTWSHFEAQVACRTSALIEARGMRAGASHHVPWLRQVLEADGPDAFFDRLGRSCDAAWVDSRPLLGQADEAPPARTRFASDLFRLSEVEDAHWRAFTEAALHARIPVVLGGHGLVSGDLYLAAEACWKGTNLARRLHPEPFAETKE